MRYGSVCSGVEAASRAWEPLGWEPIFFSEIEEFPSAVLKAHWPKIPNMGDMTKFEEWGIERGAVDVLVGGTPCQSFSIAGLRGGLNDNRGNLALTYCRMVEQLRPRWTVWENVPGVLSSNGGRDFGSIIGALAKFGYSCSWRVLDAQNFGVPQRRRRVFLVGCSSGDWRDPAAVLFESGCGNGHLKASRKERKDHSCEAGKSVARMRGFGDYEIDGTCSTAKARDYKDATDLVIHANHVAPTVTASGPPYSRTGNQGSEVDALVVHGTQENVVCIHDKATRYKGGGEARNNDGSGNGLGISLGSPMYTMTSADRHAVFSESKVRRLTPTEAERLQGFPDGHTDIGWKGKPTPDSHRYKAMGNSMAVPVMKWIGERIGLVSSY